MKLFTKGDLERCARLAASKAFEQYPIESAVHDAVELIAQNTARVYDEFTVLEIAQRAAELATASCEAETTGRGMSFTDSECAVRAFKERTDGR